MDAKKRKIPVASKTLENVIASMTDERLGCLYRSVLHTNNAYKAELHKRGYRLEIMSSEGIFCVVSAFPTTEIKISKTITKVIEI